MKKFWLLLLFLFFFVGVSGCNDSTTVNNPPEFVEMYLNGGATSLAFAQEYHPTLIRLSDDETTTDTETTTAETEYDGVIFSLAHFHVVVVTNGANYDLLYSVEIDDSELGECIYTDQSTLYEATSTIIVEDDGTYTTVVSLTIPGSDAPEEYLSERTISLTKILFTRDTVDGTFPAEIPDNSTTSLLFQVMARNYFDVELGLPLAVNGDNVDILLSPDSNYYDQAEALAMTTLVIPHEINGYEVGKVFLKDLPWVTSLQIRGGTDDIFVLGDFSALTTLVIDGPEFVSLTGFKNITLTADFAALTSISIANVSRYNLFLVKNDVIDDPEYSEYATDPEMPYAFPALTALFIFNSVLDWVKIGADPESAIPFPSLETIAIADSVVGNSVFIGAEANVFDQLASVTVSGSNIGSLEIAGTKDTAETPATLSVSASTVANNLTIRGSLISTLTFTTSILGNLIIEGGEINPSMFSGITFDDTTFEASQGLLNINGSHPHLVNLAIIGVDLNQINIGEVDSVFEHLVDIVIADVSAWSIRIGERDVSFPLLEGLQLTNIDCGWNVTIGGESAVYSALERIEIASFSAQNVTIGGVLTDMSAVTTIICGGLEIVDTFTISSQTDFSLLENIAILNLTADHVNINPGNATYDLHIDSLEATTLYIAMPGCQKIYLPEMDVTTWDFYDYATSASIPMETGTYTP